METAQQKLINDYWGQGAQKKVFRHVQAISLVTPADGLVLDVGCGDGLFLGMLEEKGIECLGTDMSEVAVRACEAKGQRVLLSDFSNGVLPEAQYKTAVCLDVLEHLFDPRPLLETLHGKAEYIIVSVPNFVSLPARLQVLFGKVPENNTPRKGHVYWFTLDVLKRILRETGWVIIELKGNSLFAERGFFGKIMGILCRWIPSLFYLSFIVRAKRISNATS